MLDFIDARIVAAVQILTAIGIARFWITWLRTEHEEPWLPVGYVEHERCFVYPDSVLAALMVVAAILLILGNALPKWIVVVGGIDANVPHTVGLATLWAAAILTLLTGWDYLRVGLKHMD